MKMLKGQQADFMGFIFAAVVLLIGAITFAMVFNATGNGTFTQTTLNASGNGNNTHTNFTVFLTNTPVVPASETVINCTEGSTLTIDVDYRLNYGDGNFTIISGDLDGTCDMLVVYRVDRVTGDATFDTSSELINTTAGSALDLVAVALIILAAAIILGFVLLMGRRA